MDENITFVKLITYFITKKRNPIFVESFISVDFYLLGLIIFKEKVESNVF